ncbi:MAG: hypothetical protein ACXVM0_16740 [Flavisolibacter sp.]
MKLPFSWLWFEWLDEGIFGYVTGMIKKREAERSAPWFPYIPQVVFPTASPEKNPTLDASSILLRLYLPLQIIVAFL